MEPLHETGERPRTIDDLALLCSNCHRMTHRKPPWPTPSQLRDIMGMQRDGRRVPPPVRP
jgi:5-methylcytosine-specific restriction protein A